MAGYKETPRQKMIGMMYLVYTALLAMNVSKDILDAFDTVNNGVQTTNITLMHRLTRSTPLLRSSTQRSPRKLVRSGNRLKPCVMKPMT